MKASTWAVVGPSVAVALVVVAIVSAMHGGPTPCREIQTHLGRPAEAPSGNTALVLYEQWPEDGSCRGRSSVAVYAPGESWEDEAITPNAIVDLADGRLPEVRRRAAWVAWHPSGARLAVGLGAGGSALLYVDRLPTREDAGRFLACGTASLTSGPDGELRWPSTLPPPESCQPVETR